MEAAFVYGTVHQFVLTTEATLLKDTGYVQTRAHQAELLPCGWLCSSTDSQVKSGMTLGCYAKGRQSDLVCFSKTNCCWAGPVMP